MKTLQVNAPQIREFIRHMYDTFLFTNETFTVGEEVKITLFDEKDKVLIGDSDVLDRRYKVKTTSKIGNFNAVKVEEIK